MNPAPEQILTVNEPALGLEAWVVLDSTRLGPAAGGVRTQAYPSPEAALADALALARAMTLKCALAGLDAGGGKAVVRLTPELQREAAFEHLGEVVAGLQGRYHCAGDLGTTAADLAAMARRAPWVHQDTVTLGAAAGRGVVAAMGACARHAGRAGLAGLQITIQGCGDMGQAVAQAATAAGARVSLCDLDRARAEALAAQLRGQGAQAQVIPAEDAFTAPADLFAPCAGGGVLGPDEAQALSAWGVCGAANNPLRGPEVEAALLARGVRYVPDFLASAGAVIEGVGRAVMGLHDTGPLLDRVGDTALTVLRAAEAQGALPSAVAQALAMGRVEAA